MVRAAQALVVALVVLALARAVTLELDPYDTYEVRTSARAVAGDPTATLLVYRSPLLTLAEAPLERWGRGSRATWVFPHVLTALAYGGLALAAVALARAAGASRGASWLAGVAVALDRLAWADAPLGLPDGLAAALATFGLARGLALLEAPRARPSAESAPGLGPADRSPARLVVETGLLLGLAAATRPNVGIAGLPLLVGAALADRSRRASPGFSWLRGGLAQVAVASLLAAAVAFFVATLVFSLGRGSLAAGLAAHADLVRFQREQLAENAARYGRLFPPARVYLGATFFMEPAVALLLPFALVLPWPTPTKDVLRARVLTLMVVGVFASLCLFVGHGEARYSLPALVAAAASVAVFVDRVASRLAASPRLRPPSSRARAVLPWARRGLAVAWVALPLALGLDFEARRATDPTLRHNFSREVAASVAAVASSTTRVLWAPDLPFPVYPAVLADDGTPFRGDPFHGIAHAGPVTVGYHLERPIALLKSASAARDRTVRSELEELAARGFLEEHDVVLLGVERPGLSWNLSPERPQLRILEVAHGQLVERRRVGPTSAGP